MNMLKGVSPALTNYGSKQAETVGRRSVEQVFSLVKSSGDAERSLVHASGVMKATSCHWSGRSRNAVVTQGRHHRL